MLERDVARPRPVEKREAEPAALRDHRDASAAERALRLDRPGIAVERRREGWAERGGDIGEALAVRPAHRHVVALRDRAQLLLHARAALARLLREAGGEDDGGLDAGLAAALELGRDVLRGHDQDREIDHLRERIDRGVGLEAL